MTKARPPRRGDVIRLNFDPKAGHEQSGFRPAIVVSHSTYNEHSSTVVVCPVTSRVRDWPFNVVLPKELPVQGAVLVDQITTVDWRARSARIACACPDDVLDEIDAKLDVLLRGAVRPAM